MKNTPTLNFNDTVSQGMKWLFVIGGWGSIIVANLWFLATFPAVFVILYATAAVFVGLFWIIGTVVEWLSNIGS